jgi:hypothetical protein
MYLFNNIEGMIDYCFRRILRSTCYFAVNPKHIYPLIAYPILPCFFLYPLVSNEPILLPLEAFGCVDMVMLPLTFDVYIGMNSVGRTLFKPTMVCTKRIFG